VLHPGGAEAETRVPTTAWRPGREVHLRSTHIRS